MKARIAALIIAGTVAGTVAGAAAPTQNASKPVASRKAEQYPAKSGFSPVRLRGEAVINLQKRGINVHDRLPAHYTKGPHSLNPMNIVGVNPVAPAHNAVVLLMRFKDSAPTRVPLSPIPAAKFNDMLFGDTYNPYTLPQFAAYASENGIPAPTNRTVKNYYKEVSYGKMALTGTVVEVQMPRPRSDYKIGQPYGVVQNDFGDFTIAELMRDAVMAADPFVDFSQFAVNGIVPDIFLIHPGSGAEWNSDPRLIWSHNWTYLGAYYFSRYGQTGDEAYLDPANWDPSMKLIVDGVAINNYSIEPEVGGDLTGFSTGTPTGPFPPQAGVYAHEFGHVLGLPDEYDYGYDALGTGIFSVMATGSWYGFPYSAPYSGNTPSHFDPWAKMYLGFAAPKTITQGLQTVTLKPSAISADFIKIVVPNSNGSEYFLIENRQPVAGSFDSCFSYLGADAKGLCVYHIDENVLARNFSRCNEAQNAFESRKQAGKPDPATGETHYAISLIQKDDRWDLEKNLNEGDANDFFKPGDVLSPNSTPNSGSYYCNAIIQGAVSNYTGIVVKDIVQNKDGSMTFKAGFEQ